MSLSPLKPRYPHARIQSLDSLAAALGIPLPELQDVSTTASSLYRNAKPIQKPDGSIRQPIDALPRLKRVQRQIQSKLLKRVQFPTYLTGSIRGGSPRANAALHAAPGIVVSEDITKFFPSTRAELVYKVWAELFGFSQPVSELLTTLTTKDGFLPEGACTSSYLANLVFWDCEPQLHAKLHEMGAFYSRYVDDITISAKSDLKPSELTRCISLVYGMFRSRGYDAKRSKHEISRGDGRMSVTKLVVNQKPSLPQDERHAIRAAVFQLERMAEAMDAIPEDFRSKLNSVSGRVVRLAQFHPTQGNQLKLKLAKLRERCS